MTLRTLLRSLVGIGGGMGLLSTPAPGRLRPACRSHSAGWDWSWGRIFANRVRILANTFTLRVDEKQIDRGRRILTTRATLSNLHNPGRLRCPPAQRPVLDPGWKHWPGFFCTRRGERRGPYHLHRNKRVGIATKNLKNHHGMVFQYAGTRGRLDKCPVGGSGYHRCIL
jgi:hypothetical protein